MTAASNNLLRHVIRASGAGMVLAVLLAVTAPSAQVQPGSTGGSIGRQGKSISGDEQTPSGTTAPTIQQAPQKKQKLAPVTPANTEKQTIARCPDIVGAWNSWASGMFGKGDATFNRDGSAVHRSGISGKWWCENGQLHIDWSDGKPGIVRVTANGKQIINRDGGIHASRD
jgi:hypothetical protein